MTDSAQELAQMETCFPLVVGDTFRDHDGASHLLNTASVAMKSADVVDREVVLRQGPDCEWWAPTAYVD